MVLEIASDAAGVLSNMPLPAYSSYQLVLQVHNHLALALSLVFLPGMVSGMLLWPSGATCCMHRHACLQWLDCVSCVKAVSGT